MNIWVILLAAGSGKRLESFLGGKKKQFLFFKKRPLFWHSALTFSRIPPIKGIVFVLPPSEIEKWRGEISSLASQDCFMVPYRIVPGGEERQISVKKGLEALPDECTHVLVHDSVRIFVKPSLVKRIIDALERGEGAVIPAIGVTDTIKFLNKDKIITLDRKKLRAVQTPQGFEKDLLCRAHERAREHKVIATDDASLVEEMGIDITLVEGDVDNIKITHGKDLRLLQESSSMSRQCIGFGYDVHRYGNEEDGGRKMRLGGVEIPKSPLILAHSDGDVLVHALIDALLGCMGIGDIGDLFPDTDPNYEGINSLILLAEVIEKLQKESIELDHVDITVVCETPKISPYKAHIKKNLSRLLHLSPSQLNVKATTEERMGFTGEKRGIKVYCVAIGRKENQDVFV